MNRDIALEKKLRIVLTPISPRMEYVAAEKRRFQAINRMPVELAQPRSMAEAVTLAALGLGAVATIAAVATIGVKLVGVVSSGAILMKAANDHPAKKQKPSMV